MTKEEIEALIEARVAARLATLTAQFGRDLSERFPTKQEVDRSIEARFKRESDAVEEKVQSFAKDLRDKDLADEDHPLSFLVDMAKMINSLHHRVMQLGMYVLAKETKVPKGPVAVERVLKLAKLEALMVGLERQRFREQVEHIKRSSDSDPALVAAVVDLYEVLCAEPASTPESKLN